jgi:hypothetical protein
MTTTRKPSGPSTKQGAGAQTEQEASPPDPKYGNNHLRRKAASRSWFHPTKCAQSSRPAAQLLASLVAERAEIRHKLLDRLPQNTNTSYIREVLVTTGILPPRQEQFAQLQLSGSTRPSKADPSALLQALPLRSVAHLCSSRIHKDNR